MYIGVPGVVLAIAIGKVGEGAPEMAWIFFKVTVCGLPDVSITRSSYVYCEIVDVSIKMLPLRGGKIFADRSSASVIFNTKLPPALGAGAVEVY